MVSTSIYLRGDPFYLAFSYHRSAACSEATLQVKNVWAPISHLAIRSYGNRGLFCGVVDVVFWKIGRGYVLRIDQPRKTSHKIFRLCCEDMACALVAFGWVVGTTLSYGLCLDYLAVETKRKQQKISLASFTLVHVLIPALSPHCLCQTRLPKMRKTQKTMT